MSLSNASSSDAFETVMERVIASAIAINRVFPDRWNGCSASCPPTLAMWYKISVGNAVNERGFNGALRSGFCADTPHCSAGSLARGNPSSREATGRSVPLTDPRRVCAKAAAWLLPSTFWALLT
ncbi:hypothetical protein [Mycetohabitans sp. B4]|uniref:hypothetical protein n=2 Tax=Burkholderiales TaxID=80840 RepID=UPI001F2C8874|nr:hypothetical protein [Mycetohabitans sp. B4]MCG1018296.1 hypothetical protein [Mycetohabitans sp. B4]